ncbi:MAG: hypothetical protein QM726_20140 [Chitinophagaceae bacterium]
MKKCLYPVTLAMTAIIFLAACSSSKHAAKDSAYIPFTKQLKQRIETSQLDIKKVQFFLDQKLVLRRSLGTQKSEIKSGVILFENGQYINEVIIPKNTPGVCENVIGDKLMISFEVQNNSIAFGPGGLNGNYFTLYARNWNNGAAEMTYDNNTYKVQCATCANVGEVRLAVMKSEADKLQRSQRVVEGRKVTD